MDAWKSLMEDPVAAGIVLAVLGAFGAGLAVIWKALTRAIVRALNQVAPSHVGDDLALMTKVRRHEGRDRVDSLMTTMAPGFVIKRQMTIRQDSIPPGTPPPAIRELPTVRFRDRDRGDE